MVDARSAHVRRAYERARVARSMPWLVPAALLGIVAVIFGSHTAVFSAPLLGVALAAARWRGGDIGRGAVAGLLAGLLPFVGLTWFAESSACGTSPWCAPMCVSLGLATVAALGPGLRRNPPIWGLAALGIASLTSAMSCWLFGATGGLVVVVLLAIGMPVATVARA